MLILNKLAERNEGEERSAEKEEMAQLYAEISKKVQEGEITRGKVVGITDNFVLVDIGFKSEGLIPLEEFQLDKVSLKGGDKAGSPELPVKIGDEIEVYLEEIENEEGQLVLSKQKADFMKVWDEIKQAYDTQRVIEGRALRKVKGGMIIDIMGIDAFLPGSQVGLHPVENLDKLLGQKISLKIVKLNKKRRNIVVSRRAVLEEKRERERQLLLADLQREQIREGVVKNITNFGAFVDLGGIDGLLHITDMSWGRIDHPSDLLSIGQKLKVKIIEYDKDKERVSLGLKQLTPHPWEKIEAKYPTGSKVRGKIVSIMDYGAFIELEKGIEGLIHISEMSWTRQIKHPSKVLAIGDVVEAVVLSINKEEEKISLSLRQIEPDPWLSIEERYLIGTKVIGKVRNLTIFGAFVEIEEGISGLIHISDLSWTKKIRHPGEILKKGERVEVVILSVDKDSRRISLGLKQLSEDPWKNIEERFSIGQTITGKILETGEKGFTVDMGNKFEGFLPLSEVSDEIAKTLSSSQEVVVCILEIDKADRRIVLSQKAQVEAQQKAEISGYIEEHKAPPITFREEEEKTSQTEIVPEKTVYD
ncbi:MAG: 30S ribosomal protein S1 [Candidatus Edwardsbacteria bacterium]